MENKECAICLEEIGNTNSCVTPCGHKFCFNCMVKALKQKDTCPMCRTALQEESDKESDEESDEEINIENDIFFETYKNRIQQLIKFYNTGLTNIKEKLNYNHNLLNIIRKIVKPEFVDAKYICDICQSTPKDIFINCGHSLCTNCYYSIKNNNSKCPYCSEHIISFHKLYL